MSVPTATRNGTDATASLSSSSFFRLASHSRWTTADAPAPRYDTANIGGVVAMPNWLQTFGESRRGQGFMIGQTLTTFP